jgi:hypothetical protein
MVMPLQQKLIAQELQLVVFYIKYAELLETDTLTYSLHEYNEAKSRHKTKSVASAAKAAAEHGTCTKITV